MEIFQNNKKIGGIPLNSLVACWHIWSGAIPWGNKNARARLIKRNQIQQVSQHRKTLFFFFGEIQVVFLTFHFLALCLRMCVYALISLSISRVPSLLHTCVQVYQTNSAHTYSTGSKNVNHIQTSHRTVKVQPYERVMVYVYVRISNCLARMTETCLCLRLCERANEWVFLVYIQKLSKWKFSAFIARCTYTHI